MSRGPQNRIPIQPGWWNKLQEECERRDFEGVKELCKGGKFLSAKTIENAFKHPEGMTEASFWQLAKLLGYKNSHALREAWSHAGNQSARSGSVSDNPVARIFTTQFDMLQWADPWEINLGNRQLETLSCTMETESAYFRFGFKLMTEQGRLFGDGSLRSQDRNLIIHIGRNNGDRPPITARDIFLTWVGVSILGRRISPGRPMT